jgi:hypothetical protein
VNSQSVSEQPGYALVQRQFAAHLRDPEHNPAPAGIEDRRLAIYRGLFYRNIEGFVRGAFPVLHAILADDHWHTMVRDFMARHQCQTPYFLEISQEFIHYLQQTREPAPEDPPFLQELAHYEWVELALDIAQAQPEWHSIDSNGDLLQACPVVSATTWSLVYSYPVHRIGREYQPAQAPTHPTYLLVYRDRENAVKFMEINAVTARLMEIIGSDDSLDEGLDEGLTGEQALRQLAAEMEHPEPEKIVGFGSDILSQWHQRGIVLGVSC